MYQPDVTMTLPDAEISAFEIPTARQTTDAPPKPPHGCPPEPTRECLLRHLYAVKHNHFVLCATCGPMAAKVSASKKKAKKAEIKLAAVGTPAERKRKYDREYEKVRNERRTKEQMEAAKQRKRERSRRSREKNRDRINEQKRLARAQAREAKLAAMTPEQLEAIAQAKRQRGLANLAKAHAANAATREAERISNMERVKEKRRANHAERMEAKKLRSQAKAPARQADREAAIVANMELARAGSKPASRCEAVVLAMEWMIEAGITDVAMLDFMAAVNKFMSKKVANSGALGRSVRDYGLTVRTEYRGKGTIKAFLYLDDKAREFISEGYKKHARGGFK